MPVPVQCQNISDEIDSLKQERTDLQTQLKSAPTNQKAALTFEIKKLNQQIKAKQPVLDNCIAQYPVLPVQPPEVVQPVFSRFTGTVTLTTNAVLMGEPFTSMVSWDILFKGGAFDVIAFAPWVIDTSADAPSLPILGKLTNFTTISYRTLPGSGGSYVKPTGEIVWAMPLNIDHSLQFGPVKWNSTLDIVLTTGRLRGGLSGTPMNSSGEITLVGRAPFVEGWLDQVVCTMVVTGIFNPVP